MNRNIISPREETYRFMKSRLFDSNQGEIFSTHLARKRFEQLSLEPHVPVLSQFMDGFDTQSQPHYNKKKLQFMVSMLRVRFTIIRRSHSALSHLQKRVIMFIGSYQE